MFATYNETVAWIHSLLPHGVKPGLKRVEWMLDELGHPERRLRTVHVGGTNGKGSTVSFLRHMMQEGGYRVGTFTSPYIVRFNERISVDGEGISDSDLIAVANRVKPLARRLKDSELNSPTEFEVITVMAMLYFAEIAVPDYVLFEVGLGGRLDSTNVIHPFLSVITNVGYDHTAILGNRIEQIAMEKAGIIKPGTAVVTASDKLKALEVIRETCAERNAKLYVLNGAFSYDHNGAEPFGELFSYRSPFIRRKDLLISMKGHHQIKNASVALMAIDYLKQYGALVLNEADIREGLKKASWPGRFEQVSRTPLVILDGAHNPEGVTSLAETIKCHYPDKRIHVLLSAMKDKNIKEMLQPLQDVAAKMIFTSFSFKRADSAESLYEQSDFTTKVAENDWKRALERELFQNDGQTLLIVTGSLYFISEVRNFFKKV